jgi:hypothetical protein
MTSKHLGTRFDARVGTATERIARRITRRDAVRTAILTGAATVGAIAVGQVPARAAITCPQKCGPSPMCTSPACPTTSGCPSGKVLCKKPPSTCSACEYATGSWVHCHGYGRCGQGFTLCQDCHKSGSCYVCICLSGILCGQCCSPADVLAEYQRTQELNGAPA